MEFLARITDIDLGLETKEKEITQIRRSARGVFFDDEGKMALMHVKKRNFHKLPGGGLEEGEDIEQALRREFLEETGCEIRVEGEVGYIEEFRYNLGIEQTSYCYFGKIITRGQPSFDAVERKEDYELVWLKLEEAIKFLKTDQAIDYSGKIIGRRELVFAKKAKEILEA